MKTWKTIAIILGAILIIGVLGLSYWIGLWQY